MRLALLLLVVFSISQDTAFRLPIQGDDLFLTEIGEFGLNRKARPSIPAHLHTGIDILPPNKNYLTDEPIYPISKGVVISKRTDGPYAQLILEHDQQDSIFWSVYEHIAEIEVELFQPVDTDTRIARFFKAQELDNLGWQFNHFHFEVLKKRPIKIKADPDNPDRLFNSYSLSCHTVEDLNQYFYNPIRFLERKTSN